MRLWNQAMLTNIRRCSRQWSTSGLMAVCTMAAAVLFAPSAQASILVGTFVKSQAETITEINQLIDDYNSDFNTSLPNVLERLDKIEGQDAADFEEGNLELGDFDFYEQDDAGATDVDIFDENVSFSASTLGPLDGFDTLDNRVFAFDQHSGPSFEYYVSKGGKTGWSLWSVMPGINPAYTDAGTGDSSIIGSDFTRGAISNNGLEHDPATSGVSHISFYASIPEPSNWCLALLSLAALAGRRRRVIWPFNG
jgi:hypothetical protein